MHTSGPIAFPGPLPYILGSMTRLLFTGQSLSQMLQGAQMKTKPTGIPLVGQPQGTEQAGGRAGSRSLPQAALVSCSTFPGCIGLATAATMVQLPHFCSSDTNTPLELYSPASLLYMTFDSVGVVCEVQLSVYVSTLYKICVRDGHEPVLGQTRRRMGR